MLLLLLLDAAFSSPAKFAMNRLTSRRWIVLRLLVLLRVLSVSSFLSFSRAIMLANFYVVIGEFCFFFFSFSTVSSCLVAVGEFARSSSKFPATSDDDPRCVNRPLNLLLYTEFDYLKSLNLSR